MIMDKGRRVVPRGVCGERVTHKRKLETAGMVSPYLLRALYQRQTGGKRVKVRPPERLSYPKSKTLPPQQRHDRVILGFTADGEHVILCCGPLCKPSYIEFRRVHLQYPGLYDPREPVWMIPLHMRTRWRPFVERSPNGAATYSFRLREAQSTAEWEPSFLYEQTYGGEGHLSDDVEDSDEEEDESDEEGGDLQMSVAEREPASVSVTESSDGYLVVVVVALRCTTPSLGQEEERVYCVFIAPGPAYLADARAPGTRELPFVGSTFTYIVNATEDPSSPLAAHDIGVIGGQNGRATGERGYIIVLNAVDTIHILEVTLHTENGPSSIGSFAPSPPLPGTKFVVRPSTPRGHLPDCTTPDDDDTQKEDGRTEPMDGWRREQEDAETDDNGCTWWAVGDDLPSAPLISTSTLACRPPIVRAHAPFVAARGGGSGGEAMSQGVSSQGSGSQGAGAGFREGELGDGMRSGSAGGSAATVCADGAKTKPRARASIAKSRQRVFNIEAFMSELLSMREALPRRDGGRWGAKKAKGDKDTSPDHDALARDDRGDVPMATLSAIDYHCVTVGLTEGGHQVILCLVIKFMYKTSCEGNAGKGRRVASGGSPGAKIKNKPGFLGHVLGLDLKNGEVSVLETQLSRGTGMKCAPQCDALVRSVRRSGQYSMARPGRRITNEAVLQGRSLPAINNPVYPVTIVRD